MKNKTSSLQARILRGRGGHPEKKFKFLKIAENMLRPHPQPSPANIDIHRTPWNNFLNPRMFSSVVLKAQIYKRIEYSYLNVLVNILYKI